MTISIRPAEQHDVPAIIALLLADAKVREQLNPALWQVAPDAAARVETSLATIAQPVTGPMRHHWLVAERGGVLVAVAHGINLPAPPIYDLKGATAGILFDDSHFAADAAVSNALLEAMEGVLRASGTSLFIAASPERWTERTGFLEAAGYERTTLYMAKQGLAAADAVAPVRRAEEADVPGIVRLSAMHRARLQIANPIFWNIHVEADKRFATWMTMSLGLADRTMFVAGPPERIDGFLIAQPGTPLHFPAAHDAARTGLIDDYYDIAFEGGGERMEPGLLAAGEDMFHAQGIDVALAICPARMPAKVEALRGAGYETANLWMVKPDRRR